MAQKENKYILEKVELGGMTYDVIVRSNGVDSNSAGLCKTGQTEITLFSYTNNNPISVSGMEMTYFHEVMHAMLDAIGYNDLMEDEQFVQAMGNMLYQYMKQALNGKSKRKKFKK